MATAASPAPHPSWSRRDWLYVLAMLVLGPFGVAIMLMGPWTQRAKVTAGTLWLLVFGAAFGLQWMMWPLLVLLGVALLVVGNQYEKPLGAIAVAVMVIPVLATLLPPQHHLTTKPFGNCTTVYVEDSVPGGFAELTLHAQGCNRDGVMTYLWEDCTIGGFVTGSRTCGHRSGPNGELIVDASATYRSPVLPVEHGWGRAVAIEPDGSVRDLSPGS